MKNTGMKNTGLKKTGMKNTSIKNTGMKNKNRNETGPKWKSILIPLLLAGCLVFPGIFSVFPAGPFLPDSFLSVSAAVYAAEPTAGEADPEEGSPAQAALSDRDRMLPDGEKPDDDLRVGDGDPALPAWYPKDPLSFPFYHDEKAPRVIDIADIFSGEEDNGYGIGPDREGVCLMICMEPGNRGWWCCCTGPVTRGLYDETVANQIDDMLYDYMKAGDYGTGVEDWIENIRRLYTTGSPYSEEWAVMDEASFKRFHDPDAPRVVDDAKLLSDSEIEKLTQKAADLSEKTRPRHLQQKVLSVPWLRILR